MDQQFCTACGHRLGPGDLFCTACGAPVAASTPAGPATQVAAAQVSPTQVNPTQVSPAQAPVERTAARPAIAPFPQDSRVHPAAARTPVRRPRPRHPRLRFWSWVAAAAVVVGVVSYTLGTMTRSDDRSAASLTPSAVPTHPTRPPSPRASIDPQAMAQARALYTLISQSATDKQRIATAATQLQRCDHLAEAIQTFSDAAASRDRLVEQASSLNVGLLPGGGEAIADLREALRSSAAADRAYVAWGESRHKVTITIPGSGGPAGHGKGHGKGHGRPRPPEHRQVCRGGADLEAQAVALSTASHGAKQQTARAWNIVAAQFGLPTITWTEL